MNKLIIACGVLLSTNLFAHDRFANVEIETHKLTDTVYMLKGAGGNIGLSIGADGALMVDDQFEPIAPKISEAINKIAENKVKYLINTHYHGDHVSSNAWFKKMDDATIFAHDNVRERLSNDEKSTADSLPVVTYEQGIKFHFNDDTIHVIHRPNSHTDGDSFIYFEKQNVIHTGDLMFNKWFPYIDLDSGGTIEGYIESTQAMHDMADENTKVIPGHGPVASKKDLANTLNMLKTTLEEVLEMKKQGLSAEQAVAKGLSEKWGPWSWNFINEERWIRTLYKGTD